MIGCDHRDYLEEYDVIDRIASLATGTLANALDDTGYLSGAMAKYKKI